MSKKQIEILALESGSTATRTSERFLTPEGKGIILGVKLANLVTTPTFEPKIQVLSAGGIWVDYWTAAAALSANGDVIYLLYPVNTPGGDAVEKVNLPCPFSWRVVMTFGGTGSVDTLVTAQVI